MGFSESCSGILCDFQLKRIVVKPNRYLASTLYASSHGQQCAGMLGGTRCKSMYFMAFLLVCRPARVHTRDVRPWLDLVDELRSHGISQDLPLPQIAVMGDQSCGKSSVLEVC